MWERLGFVILLSGGGDRNKCHLGNGHNRAWKASCDISYTFRYTL